MFMCRECVSAGTGVWVAIVRETTHAHHPWTLDLATACVIRLFFSAGILFESTLPFLGPRAFLAVQSRSWDGQAIALV